MSKFKDLHARNHCALENPAQGHYWHEMMVPQFLVFKVDADKNVTFARGIVNEEDFKGISSLETVSHDEFKNLLRYETKRPLIYQESEVLYCDVSVIKHKWVKKYV